MEKEKEKESLNRSHYKLQCKYNSKKSKLKPAAY